MLYLTLDNGAQGIVELSKTRNLRNTALIRGDRGELEVNLLCNHVSALPKELLDCRFDGLSVRSFPQQSVADCYRDLFILQLKDWCNAIQQEGRLPFISCVEAARSVTLIDDCYKNRRTLEQPWVRPEKAHCDPFERKIAE